jgi:Ig-like domain from next to BRCA1 gene
MRKSILHGFILGVLCLLLWPQQAQAQYAYGYSGIAYDTDTHEVFGLSLTELDYYAGTYYDPYVEGFMYYQYSNYPIDYGADRGYESYFDAEVDTYSPSGLPNTEYDVISDHYVISWYSVDVTVCDYYGFYDGCGYDPFGFSYLGGGDFGGFNYFYGPGYGGYVPERTYYIGSTGVGIITPPDTPSCESLNVTIGAFYPQQQTNIQNTTKSALLGANVVLAAGVSPSRDGTYTWSVSGPHQQDTSSSADGSVIDIQWTAEGTQQVTVTFTPANSSCTYSTSLNVNVVLPTMTGFTAEQNVEQVHYGSEMLQCSHIESGDTFSLGCSSTASGQGIHWLATAQAPDDIISSPDSSLIRFVQIISGDRRRDTSRGHECVTSRANTADVDSGWRIDTVDPYDDRPHRGVSGFALNAGHYSASLDTGDTPGNRLSTAGPNIPLQYNHFFADDHFQTYIKYYVGEPDHPLVERLLGRVIWQWGGDVSFDPSSGIYSFTKENTSVHFQPVEIYTGAATTNPMTPLASPVPYAPTEADWQQCGFSPTPTPTPTPTPFPTPTPPGGGTGNNAKFISQSVPTSMQAGQTYTVSVTMQNTGSTTWTDQGNYHLGSQNPQDNLTWGINRVSLPAAVTPGGQVTFTFDVTAPTTPGSYDFQWRMVQDGVEWFGDFTPDVLVDVAGAGCDPSAEDDCYYNGGSWNPTTCTCHYCAKCDWYTY